MATWHIADAQAKSGVLAIYYACREARKEDLDRLSIWCVFNPDEELGSRASQGWLEEIVCTRQAHWFLKPLVRAVNSCVLVRVSQPIT